MARAEIVGGTPCSAQDRAEKSIDTTVLFLDTASDSIRQGEQVRLADVADVGLHTQPRVEDEEYDKASE
jgi:hypothetical protein